MRGRRRSSQQKDPARHLLCTPASPPRGLHGTQVAAASRVLLLLDDGSGRGGAGHRLVALRAPGFCCCLHGVAAGMGVSATETGDAVRGGGVDGSNDARAPLLVELAWSGELLNRAPAWVATGSVGRGEGGGSATCIARIRRATQPACMRNNYSS